MSSDPLVTEEDGPELVVSTKQQLQKFSNSGYQLLANIAREDIRLVYTFKKRLGSGAFGTVRVAYKTINPKKVFAIKSIERETLKGEEKTLQQELGILISADHPNIVKLYEVFLDHKYIHLVTELLGGGEIEPGDMPNGHFTEPEVAKILRQCL